MAGVVEALPVPHCTVGEGPHWSPRTQSLYLVDIEEKNLYRYHPTTNSVFSVNLGAAPVGFVSPVRGSTDEFLVGTGLTLRVVRWDGSSDRLQADREVVTLPGDPDLIRINDGKVDSTGRVWFGTMKRADIFSSREGSLYSYKDGEGLKHHLSGIGISNGLAWNETKSLMYYIDSLCRSVDVMDYNSVSGSLENRRVVFDLQKNKMDFFPDGMTIDSDGKLWVACFRGSRLLHIDPDTSALMSEVHLPTLNVTSAAWGGQDLSDLYVTTAKNEGDADSGRTFRVRGLGCRGLPMNEFAL